MRNSFSRQHQGWKGGLTPYGIHVPVQYPTGFAAERSRQGRQRCPSSAAAAGGRVSVPRRSRTLQVCLGRQWFVPPWSIGKAPRGNVTPQGMGAGAAGPHAEAWSLVRSVLLTAQLLENLEKRSFLGCLPWPRKTLSGLEIAINVWAGPVSKAETVMTPPGPSLLFADSVLRYGLHPPNTPYSALRRKTFWVLWEQWWTDRRAFTLRYTTCKAVGIRFFLKAPTISKCSNISLLTFSIWNAVFHTLSFKNEISWSWAPLKPML